MRVTLPILACLICLSPSARAETYVYQISMLNIPIGKATVELQRDKSDYTLSMSTEFGGIVALFTGAKGNVETTGVIQASGRAAPVHTNASVQWGKKIRRAAIDYNDNGDVIDMSVKPKYSYNEGERHPLDKSTLVGLQDSLSAMYRPLKDGKLDCTVRPRIFDTRETNDLQFKPTADPMTCIVQPVPVSGYNLRYDKKPVEPLTIKFMPVDNGTRAIPAHIIRDMWLGHLELNIIKGS